MERYKEPVGITNPEILKYIKNQEDAYSYTRGSAKCIDFICPLCGKVKSCRVATVVLYGFSCDFCSDGISYGEKYLISLFEQLNIKFDRQFAPEWGNSRRYDFKIKDTIVEVHGMQHYEDKKFNMEGCRTLKEEQENDRLKKELALRNGIEKYIVIDCRYSTPEWIKKSIIEELENIFDLSRINWGKCDLDTFNSRIIESCSLYNEGYDVKDIANKLHVSKDSIRIWLNKCREAGLCDYDGVSISKNASGKKIKNTITNKSYNSFVEASKDTGLYRKRISKMCYDNKNTEWIFI